MVRGYRYAGTHYVHAIGSDHRPGLYFAAVYGDAALLEKLDRPLLEAAKDLGASKLQTFIRIIIPLTMPGIIAGCLLVMLPAMGLFYVSDLMGGAKNLLIGNVIKSQFLNIRDWPFGAATSITLTLVMGLMLLIYWRAARLLNKKVELE